MLRGDERFECQNAMGFGGVMMPMVGIGNVGGSEKRAVVGGSMGLALFLFRGK